VCRTFGDVEAKMRRFGGNPNVVVCVPEIKAFKIEENEHDFVILGCDGIFDRLDNKDCIQAVWNSV
jgi:protein phosphatase PTC2/3